MRAIQFISECRTQAEANEQFAWLRLQDGYLGGRLREPSVINPSWRVQVFFEDVYNPASEWLPDGCRRVLIFDCQRKALGLA